VSDPRLNSMTVYDDALLLVYSGGGAKVHLAPEAGPEDDAISIGDIDIEGDPGEVTLWATFTLCGRSWSRMAPTEPTPDLDEAIHAPSCRRCLSILDRRFPDRPSADGLEVVVGLAIESLVNNGTVEIYGCPGDQLGLLRKRLHALGKQRELGSLRSHSQGDIVVFWDNSPIRGDEQQRLDKALSRLNSGQGQSNNGIPDHRIYWRHWAK
jgi:hypothetical protein